MSKTAYIVLSASVTFTAGIIYYVHTNQKEERKRLREGVFHDLDRQQRKMQNIHQLSLQADLTKLLREQQKQQDEKNYHAQMKEQTLR